MLTSAALSPRSVSTGQMTKTINMGRLPRPLSASSLQRLDLSSSGKLTSGQPSLSSNRCAPLPVVRLLADSRAALKAGRKLLEFAMSFHEQFLLSVESFKRHQCRS